jgi:hypothetical protein
VLSDLTLEEALNLHYTLFAYDQGLDAIANQPTRLTASPEYVYREAKRSVAGAEGRTRIYPGIGSNCVAVDPTIRRRSTSA